MNYLTIYATIVSSVLAVLGIYNHFKRVNLHLDAWGDLSTITPGVPQRDNQKYIRLDIQNRGQVPVTITNYVYYYWEKGQKVRQKHATNYGVIQSEKVYIVIKPGETCTELVNQNNIEFNFRDGVFKVGIMHSMSNKPALVKVRFPVPNDKDLPSKQT